jgi:hypothetical protein
LDGAGAPGYLKGMSFRARVAGWVGVVLLGSSALGCGQVTGANAGSGLPASTDRYAFAKNGDRVLALGYLSEGVAQFRVLHDQQLDFDCEFTPGTACRDPHCVPKRSAQLIFLDSNCSQPATWILYQAEHVGDWVSIFQVQSECPGQGYPRETFEIAEEIYPESTGGSRPPVYELQGTTCATAYPPAKSIPAVNRLIPHADSELVAATRVSLDVGGGLRLSRLLGEDGSEFTAAVTNAAGETCSVQADGQCLPTAAKAIGAVPTTQRVRQGSGAVHVDLFSSLSAAGGAGVPVAQIPEALDFLDDSGNRCQVVRAFDGTLRCASFDYSSALESGRWADAACTERLYTGYPMGVDPASLRVGLHADNAALTAVSTLKAYEGPVYAFENGVCVAEPADGSLLRLDRRTDASALPEVFEATL